jgi:hypothetical protein
VRFADARGGEYAAIAGVANVSTKEFAGGISILSASNVFTR